MEEQETAAAAAPENPAVVAALGKLDALDSAPLEQHAAIFEDVRSDLRAALDAD